jgi:iron(III) transport system permease protein
MLARDALNSLLLATVAAVVTLAAAVLVAATSRARPSRMTSAAVGAASLGYAVPGTVVAVAVYVPLAWVDRRLGALVFSGTVLGLVLAYVVRFHALALASVRSRFARIDPSLDEAARALGADRGRVLAEVQLPLLYPGLVTAALLVFVEVLKELPATALLRPLNGDTLAIAVWEATKDSRFDTAALPALLIVLVGLVPVVALMRASRGGLSDEP